MTDIVERLRSDARIYTAPEMSGLCAVMRNAADEIEASRAERDWLREIVCDLDEWADMHAVTAPEWGDNDRVKVYLSIGTLRKTRAALDQTGG